VIQCDVIFGKIKCQRQAGNAVAIAVALNKVKSTRSSKPHQIGSHKLSGIRYTIVMPSTQSSTFIFHSPLDGARLLVSNSIFCIWGFRFRPDQKTNTTASFEVALSTEDSECTQLGLRFTLGRPLQARSSHLEKSQAELRHRTALHSGRNRRPRAPVEILLICKEIYANRYFRMRSNEVSSQL